ncbi:hypothetical protein BHYA_0040g00190 [Botrytis hyacinthi]|uniref:Uncharacterized protein n=1 Tax=Botrytis hyacinthi TaxID=278943 RepID=A0A4Z1GYF4_9HELO|nr:hypothetical protein BHYA_0040g00190 [Botrytis hyacinthi]
MSRLSKYLTSHLQETPQAPRSLIQSIELDIVDANGRSLPSPRADEMLHEIENGISGAAIAAIMSIILAVSWAGSSNRPDHHILAIGYALHVEPNKRAAHNPLAGAKNIIPKL